MKKNKNISLAVGTLVGVLALLLLASCTESAFNPALTRTFTVQASSTGATYPIQVALPEAYSANEKYASIYVLDGEENFDLVAKKCQELSRKYATQNVVVVGIGYGRDRSIDYTPTRAGSRTGGAAEFLQFLKTDLIPRMQHDFPLDTARTKRAILGHSYGGLFGACVMAVDNTLFGNYILLSPSIWFDNEVSLQLELSYRSINRNRPQLVFLGIGAAENSGRMQAPFEAFYQVLRENYMQTKLVKNLEKNMDHVGSKNPNIVKGLEFYFQNR
jgi:predicted alpha/beta superfamily hydrolase